MSLTREDHDLWLLFLQTAHMMEQVQETDIWELSTTEFEILYALDTASYPLFPGKLSDMLLREPHSVSGLVIRMEARGLLRKAKRGRPVTLELTDKGRTTLSRAKDIESIRAILDTIPPGVRESFEEILEDMRRMSLELLGNLRAARELERKLSTG